MMNYAETLAYWYLRLNGFFPLSRFVLHPPGGGQRAHAADHDLLAVRPPGVYEDVGGQPNDWDTQLFNVLGAHPDVTAVGLVVQVKGGGGIAAPGDAFHHERLDYAVKRLGMLGPDEYVKREVVTALIRAAKYELPDLRDPRGHPPRIVVAKLMIGGNCEDGLDDPRPLGTYFALSLRHAVKVIRKRVEDDYATRKQNDWNHFPGDLVQFLIWEKEQLNPRR